MRFTRFWWEVPQPRVVAGDEWFWYAKGGSYILFYARIDLLVLWRNDGAEIKEWIRTGLGDHPSRHLRNLDFQFREGLTWRAVGWTTRRFGYLPLGCLFSNRGSMVFPKDVPLVTALGYLTQISRQSLFFARPLNVKGT
jgi:hypothetical protein